ncbi:MAG: methyltransferase type 12 [Burkholderiales bacterium]|nr:methyltransferase type 12 [Burkholderiales bacterium]
MTKQGEGAAVTGGEFDFLIVDQFLRTLVDARALKSAFELRLIDTVAERGTASAAWLGHALGVDEQGLTFLLGLLEANGVVEKRRADIVLSERFTRALQFRDLLEIKLDFAGFIMNDFADWFTVLLKDPGVFPGRSRLFELFDYRRCFEPTLENYERTRAWMKLTSTLTRYEAQACMGLHDFGAHRRMLDVGGNSGEFALQACRRHPELRATVLDLPLVCDIGMEQILARPERERIAFYKADMRSDPLPEGYDLIAFKSMLHDWPEEEALGFVSKAAAALPPGGSALIFERGPISLSGTTPPFSMLPILLFFRSYRRASVYAKHLQALGFENIRRREVELDTPFFLVTATKPA